MTTDLQSNINSIGLVLTILSLIWFAAVKMTRVEVKVDTMWGMLLKRAVVEGVHMGLMEVNSPIRLINNSGQILQHMEGELREFYIKNCSNCSESTAALLIEKEFGSRLAQDVCIPNKISMGVCILIALSMARGGKPLTEILDTNLPAENKKT